METLLAIIIMWLAANYELPATDRHPKVEFASPGEITSMRYQSLLGASGWQSGQASTMHEEQMGRSKIVAIYVDETETIYLPIGWRGDTPEELSILVHEMVHHLQKVGQLRYSCAQEREKLAFTAQEQWLAMFGSDLAAGFGIDRFTLAIRTNCAF